MIFDSQTDYQDKNGYQTLITVFFIHAMNVSAKDTIARYSNYFLKQIKYRLIQHQAFRLSYFGF